MAEPEGVALFRRETGRTEFPFDPPVIRPRFPRQNRRARAVAKQTGADEHAGIVVEIKCRAANLDADGQDFLGAFGGQQGLGGAQIGQRRAAALADQIQREDIRAQTEPFTHVTGKARTQIAGAGADEHGVNFRGRATGVLQGAVARLPRPAQARAW